MAIAWERIAKGFHNFDAFPYLKWESNHRPRCMMMNSGGDAGGGDVRSIARRSVGTIDHQRRELASEGRHGNRFLLKKNKNKKNVVGDIQEEGIAAVREKLMFDLKEATKAMKEAVFGRELAAEKRDDKADGDDDVAAVEVAEKVSASTAQKEARPWNLRKRKGACEKGVRIEEEKVDSSLAAVRPVRRVLPERKERAKLVVALSRKEIESDFLEMFGKRPPSRPKKRPRPTQKQLDSLFPGLLLGEISTETYKVPEDTKNARTR